MSHSENARQWVHIGSGLFGLLLRFLTWWQAAMLAGVALVFNLLLLPRIGGRRLYRPVDEARGFPVGILLYPLAVLLLILILPHRLDIAAAAWAILAFGDGTATLVGRRISHAEPVEHANRNRFVGFASFARVRSSLPWNREKTVAGMVAFIVFGGLAGIVWAAWTRAAITPLPTWTFVLVAPAVAAVVAGFVETIPVRLDDNVSVPAAAGGVLWLASLMTGASMAASVDIVAGRLPLALAINVVMSWLGYRAKTVSVAGAIGGAIIGIVIYAAGGAAAWILLFVTFAVASAASRVGLERKRMLGIEEDRGGRRGPGNAIANCGVAAAAAIAAVTTPYSAAAMLAFAAALTAGGSDTVASEAGKTWGRSTFLVTNLRRVKPGTPGAMSLEGTAAGLVAAFALAALAVALGLTPQSTILPIVIGATAGALVESALAATLEGPGILNNDMLNFMNTAVAAGVALALT